MEQEVHHIGFARHDRLVVHHHIAAKPLAPNAQVGDPLIRLHLHIDADIAQVALDVLVHLHRDHHAGAGDGNDHLGGKAIGITGFGQQFFRFGGIIRIALDRGVIGPARSGHWLGGDFGGTLQNAIG